MIWPISWQTLVEKIYTFKVCQFYGNFVKIGYFWQFLFSFNWEDTGIIICSTDNNWKSRNSKFFGWYLRWFTPYFFVRPHAGEIWTKFYGPNRTKFFNFDKKMVTNFDKVLTPFWKTFLWLKQLIDAKILMFVPYASKIWAKSYGSNYTNLLAFWQKTSSYITVFNKELTHFGRHFCSWNYCLMLNYQFKNYHLSVFQKWQHSNTCNQVKSCTKHGRPDQSQREAKWLIRMDTKEKPLQVTHLTGLNTWWLFS